MSITYNLGWSRSLYDWSPPFAKNLLASAYGLQQQRARYGRDFFQVVDELRRLEFAPAEALRDYQKQRLVTVLGQAAAETPYYGNLFRKVGLHACDIGQMTDLNCVPILGKEQVRRNRDALIPRDVSRYEPRWMHTGGTTGKALQFPASRYSYQREYAFRASHYSWAGVDLLGGERLAFAAGHPVTSPARQKPPFWSYDYANRWLLLSSYHLGRRNLPFYVRELERFAPVMLAGYPSSLYLLALAYGQWGRGTLRLRCVFASSETLLSRQRQAIEDAFGCKVFMWYGNAEMCGNIVGCEYGSYHGRLEHSVMEIVDDKGQPARQGRLIVTGLGNLAFPLVRYDVGDEVSLAANQVCPCGRGGVLFNAVVGRVEDYVITPEGNLVGRLDHLFKDAINVVEAQLVQDSPETLILRIVRRPEFRPEDKQAIQAEARARLGPSIRLKFEYADQLQRTANGKTPFIISSIAQSARHAIGLPH